MIYISKNLKPWVKKDLEAMNQAYNECWRQKEEKEVLLEAYSEALKTHPNTDLVQGIIDSFLSKCERLPKQHSQYRDIKKYN